MSKRAERQLKRARTERGVASLFRLYLSDRFGPNFWTAVPKTLQGQLDLVDLWGIHLLAQGYVLTSVQNYTRYALRWLGIRRPLGKCEAA